LHRRVSRLKTNPAGKGPSPAPGGALFAACTMLKRLAANAGRSLQLWLPRYVYRASRTDHAVGVPAFLRTTAECRATPSPRPETPSRARSARTNPGGLRPA